MKTEIIVKKEYPFCPKKVGEKLELSKINCYCVLKTTVSDIYMEFDGIKQDPMRND